MSTQSPKRVGTDSFAELLLTNNVFVDKSMFIKEFLEESGGKVALITRPRRWGKSLNMDMLKRFVAIEVDEQGAPLPQRKSLNRKLFVGGKVKLVSGDTKLLKPLKISHDPASMKYQGKFPVISLGLKDVTGSDTKKPVYEGLAQLLAAEIIARGRADNLYFINPVIAFNGNSITFAKSYIKKKMKADFNQTDLFEEEEEFEKK